MRCSSAAVRPVIRSGQAGDTNSSYLTAGRTPSARTNRTFDELDQVPITVTAGTQLAHQIAKLRKRFASRALETIDAREHQTLSLLLDA